MKKLLRYLVAAPFALPPIPVTVQSRAKSRKWTGINDKILKAIAVWLALLLPSGYAVALNYSFLDLGVLGGPGISADAINADGRIVGSLLVEDIWLPYVTGSNGQNQSFPKPPIVGSPYSWAAGINDSGQILLNAYTASGGAVRSFIFESNSGTYSSIENLGGAKTISYGINNTGQVTGFSVTSSGFDHAFITGDNGSGISDIHSLGISSSGNDINNSGRVTGSYRDTNGDYHAFITGANGSGMVSLGTLGGYRSFGTSINESSQVAGASFTATSSAPHAFVTGVNGAEMIDLGTLGGSYSLPTDINNNGVVVGLSLIEGDNEFRAFITSELGTGMVDLNQLVKLPNDVHLEMANGINDRGQIVARGTDYHIYLLTPTALIPEPSALVLLGIALAGLGATRRKKAI